MVPFKVFLSYSTAPEEQVIVWRLQTLAAASGITVFVPVREGLTFKTLGRRQVQITPSAEVRRQIDNCDCVLALITTRVGQSVQNELNYALGKNKLIIPIVEKGVSNGSFLGKFEKVFWFSPWDPPGKLETEVIQFLRQQQVKKDNQQAIGALVGIGLGLLLLYALSEK